VSDIPESKIATAGHNNTNGEPLHRTDTCNVIIFGEAGAGKSSLVNLITKEHKARISSDAVGCTTETNIYETEISKWKVKLFDTAGWSSSPIFVAVTELDYRS